MDSEIAGRIIANAVKQGRSALLESEAKELCISYGIPTPNYRVAQNEEEAAAFADELNYPIVLKVLSPGVLHKTEAGGVVVGLKTREQVREAYDQILSNVSKHLPKTPISGILVQSMAPAGVEVIVGGLRDKTFGPTVLFGLGGIFVEILKDASFRVAPITELDSRQMIEEVRGYSLLKGARGQAASDEKAVMRILEATSRIILENDRIQQIDLNPIMVYPQGAMAVDARILLA